MMKFEEASDFENYATNNEVLTNGFYQYLVVTIGFSCTIQKTTSLCKTPNNSNKVYTEISTLGIIYKKACQEINSTFHNVII